MSDSSVLNQRLLDQYSQHYARVNRSVVPGAMSRRQRQGLERTHQHLIRGLPPGSRVVDIGCGTGHLLRWLSEYRGLELNGVDQSDEQLAIARNGLADVEFTQGDGRAYMSANPGAFAGIFCFDVLEHIPGDDQLLAWIETAHSALQPGGFFCCRCPNAANLLASYSRYIDLTHQRMLTRTSLIQLLEAGGFVEMEVVPLRPGWIGGAIRMTVESWVHQMLYHLCGRRPEPIVTTNICVVGRKHA